MNITVTRKNSEKIISVYELETELSKITNINKVDINEVIRKLNRGDLLGFNDVHFKKVNK